MAKQNISMQQIADESGVSRGVISAFLSGNNYKEGGKIGISEATEQKIIASCRKLNYIPTNLSVRRKIDPNFGCFSFFINNLSAGGFEIFYSKLMFGAYSSIKDFSQMNFSVTSFDSEINYLSDSAKLPMVLNDNTTCKFMFAGAVNYSLLMTLKERKAAVVYFLREVDFDGVVSIVPDFEKAGYLAIKHLLSMGHRKIAFVGESYFAANKYGISHFEQGIMRALGEFGLIFDEDDVFFNENDFANCAKKIRENPKHYSAAFCFDDNTALKLIQALQKGNTKIPEEFSVIGCNNQPFSVLTSPPLSTIDINLHEMGELAAEILNNFEKKHKKVYRCDVTLISRESVKKIEN